ncbi:dihydrofolate reductase family protein [Microbacterium sp. CFH 90308]|uniref:Dihydrofolate reductase family protein n=1 Tax=Microbacterium salsuginis TaxID=2722803 RepID=A0ABX1K9J1_9MICO|nr:dihydrofolate reductase family protein [Microbacterium sp. CFH 90308]
MLLSVNTFVSLDSVMQGPGAPDEDISDGFDRGGWLVPLVTEESDEIVNSWFRKAEAILIGRRTFQMMRAYWSQVTNPDDLVATALNTWPKYVVSQTLSDDDAAWGPTTVVRGDVVDNVRRLKEGSRSAGELQVHGSWRLARTLHDAGLVDIVRILQFPLVVGSGKRLFPEDAAPAGYTVDSSESRVLPNGTVALTLRTSNVGQVDAGSYLVHDGQRIEGAEN